jgi:hypothetical protein
MMKKPKFGLPWGKAWMWLLEGMGIPMSAVRRVWLCECGMLWLRPDEPKYWTDE